MSDPSQRRKDAIIRGIVLQNAVFCDLEVDLQRSAESGSAEVLKILTALLRFLRVRMMELEANLMANSSPEPEADPGSDPQ